MRTKLRARAVAVAALALVVGVAACSSDDDGASVRSVDGESASASSGSGSSTGSGSGSASGSASGVSGSGSAIAGECEPVGELSTAATRVNVTLDEWVIEPDASTAPAGAIGFVLENKGEDPHELVVVKGVSPADLPLKADGSLDEDLLPAGALIGEVEAFPAGTSCNGVFDLAPGEYTLVCNVFEESEHESHLKEGMVTTFTVT
jgi:hypothetical protein